MANIYFFCSAESEADEKKVFGTDAPLTDNGRLQAIKARKIFTNVPIGIILSSSQLRAFTTAKIMFPDKYGFAVDKRFDELNFGAMEGLPITDFARERIVNNIDKLDEVVKGDNVQQRVEDALIGLYTYAKVTDKDIVLVSHDSILECMLMKIGFTNEKLRQDGGFKFWGNGKILNGHAVVLNKNSYLNAIQSLYGVN